MSIFLKKKSNFGGQKLKISKNRDSQVVEHVILPFRCLFCVVAVKIAPLTASQRVACFWTKMACHDVTKSTITRIIFEIFDKFFTGGVK